MRYKLVVVVLAVALLASVVAGPAFANPPAPDDTARTWPPVVVEDDGASVPAQATTRSYSKIDQPNAFDVKRILARLEALKAGQTIEAESLTTAASPDRVLVVLAEFGGPDTFTWTAGNSSWDPLGIADTGEYVGETGTYTACSNIITQTSVFTYSGPAHNALPRPLTASDRSGDSIWTPNFSPSWYNDFMFGNGVTFSYSRTDGSSVNESFVGKSVTKYFQDMSGGKYNMTGDVIGWVQLPHSQMWYGADKCPGARSVPDGVGRPANSGGIPGAGTARTLVTDAINAVNAISNTIPGFNWANYDTNGDGVIDRLWIVHSGYGEEDSTTLLNRTAPYGEGSMWSHSSAVTPNYSVTQNIAVGPYIMMPENGGIGVFAHESAHNLGADDLYSYGGGETSAGFWTLMADDWTGYPIGFEPPAVDPLALDQWGWLDPLVITDPAKIYTVTIGQASNFSANTGTGAYRGVKIQLAAGESPLPVAPLGTAYWWGGNQNSANGIMTSKNPIPVPVAGATLSFSTSYGIENQWDFLWVQAKTVADTAWTTLTNTHTVCNHDIGWIGGLYGFPSDMCAAGIGGFTNYNANYPGYDTETFDLSAFANESIQLRFWYMTDWGTVLAGPFVDNIVVRSGATTLFSDNAETGGANWTYSAPWIWSQGYQSFDHDYYLQWRNVNENGGYDSALGDSRWRYGPANSGLLVWYHNGFYSDNEIFDANRLFFDTAGAGPKGKMLVVDSHPEPYRDPYYVAMGYNNEGGNVPARSQMRDAPFTLQNTVPFVMTAATGGVYTNTTFAGRIANSIFNDALSYYPGIEYVSRGSGYPASTAYKWVTKQWDASVALPGTDSYGIKGMGYTGNQEVRFFCSKYTGNRLSCYYLGPGVGIGYDGSTGNPGDARAKYGWKVELVQEAADHTWATVRISNSMKSQVFVPVGFRNLVP